ncbi:hypothetical protein QTP70_003560 [Hemibagrus guttatus]|uniref:Reverse transcriptase domain-containing protein n=1 Tax=Hemibagrus guttatus TaxID=175788 RepID=A0AAE0VAI4_9TELE|nr:hypothetical protein QTP70_003560 [Hemibagrus guttatus]
MFKHKGAHQYTWYQDTLDWRSMIGLVVVSSDLRPHVSDTRGKREVELSTDHHLVGGLKLPPPGEFQPDPEGLGLSGPCSPPPLLTQPSGAVAVRVLEGSWEFAQPVHMCFVDLEKAFDRVPHGILWEVLWEYGVRGPLLSVVRSLYNRSRSLVRIASCLDLQHALGHFAASLVRCSGHAPPGRDPGEDPGHAGETMSLG